MDYAKKLIKNGHDVYIIPAKGKMVYNKLALGKYPTSDKAKEAVQDFEKKYKKKLWVARY